MFQPGDICEGLVTNPDYPAYKDVLHLVRVLRYNVRRQQYQCRSLAFDMGPRNFWWEPNILFTVRKAEHVPNNVKNIDIRICNRKVNGELVDGLLSRKGVWVRGQIRARHGQEYLVEHFDWETGETALTIVTPENVRPSIFK